MRTWTNTSLAGEAAFTPVNVGNADLGPEVTGEFEAGFDAAWFDERIRSTFTYYRAVTNDALLNYQQIPSLGFTNSQLTNVGKIENKGIELSLEVVPEIHGPHATAELTERRHASIGPLQNGCSAYDQNPHARLAGYPGWERGKNTDATR